MGRLRVCTGLHVCNRLCRFAFLQNLNFKTIATVCVAWLLATSLAAAFLYLMNPMVRQIWSASVESIDLTQSAIQQAMLILSCLICVAMGSFLNKANSAILRGAI